jgi:Tol biopolymer transport system component
MTLAPGTRLGPYEILSPLGAGGMGEVYRARDSRLGRDVAIKMVLSEFTADPDRLQRFEREARAAGSLNHPNVLTVYDVGSHEGSPYLVTELLEGETLQARMGKGALPLRTALEVGGQVAAGLAAAHERGIVHRDLKPANIFITNEGSAKILDFGLAKLIEPAGADKHADASTVVETTEPGVRLGTITYMSPEQAAGLSVDFRSDQFSLGIVLYEMISGSRPFAGDTAAETLAAIIRDEPEPLAKLVPEVPAPLRWIIERCLAKEPSGRYAATRDLAHDLETLRLHLSEVASSAGGTSAAAGPEPSRGRRARAVAAVGVVVAAAVGVATVASYRAGQKAQRRAAAGTDFRQLSFRPQAIFQAAFAPDGKTVVYSAALQGNDPELFVIRPEHPEPRPLGLPRTHLLSISSKGEMAVLTNARFVVHRLFTGTLARVSLGDTAPREILENVRQADWSPDGTELAIIRLAEGQDRLEFPIGKVLYQTAGYLSDLRVSPRGDRIALFEHPTQWDDRGSVIVVDLAGTRTLLSGEFGGTEEGLAWSWAGDEVLFTASTAGTAQALYGVDLAGRLRVVSRSAGGLTMHDVSSSGRWLVTRDDARDETMVLAPGASVERDLSWLDHSGAPHLSRDGRQLLFVEEAATAGPNYAVCLRTTDGGPVIRLGEGRPWGLSPDGKWALAIVFAPPQLVIYPTGPGEVRRLPRTTLETYQSADWFPDGKTVLVVGNEAGSAPRCYAQDISGGPPRPVTPEGTANCLVSPNGQQIVYSKPGGAYSIQNVGNGTVQQVPEVKGDDIVIRWSGDGRSLYFFSPTTVPFRFERLDLATGHRELLREVAPGDRTGVLHSWGAALSDDTRSYAYCYQRATSQLFVVEPER